MSEKKTLTESELSKVTGGAKMPRLPLKREGDAIGRSNPTVPGEPEEPGVPGGIDTVVNPGGGSSNVGLG